MPLDLLADGIDGGVRAQKAIRQRLILSQQTQQQVFGFDIRASELARLVTREKDDPACFLGITFKHRPYPFPLCSQSNKNHVCGAPPAGTNSPPCNLSIRSQRLAKELLCVTRMEVSAWERCNRP